MRKRMRRRRGRDYWRGTCLELSNLLELACGFIAADYLRGYFLWSWGLVGCLEVAFVLLFLWGFVVVHVSHEDFLGILLVDEDVCFYKLDAFVVGADLHSEVVAEEVQEVFPLEVAVKGVGLACEYEDGPEEVDEDGIHDGIVVEVVLYCASLAENTEELGDELFELQITEDGGIVVLVEDELEILVVDDLFDLADVALVVHALQLEAKFEVLVIEHPDVGLRVVVEGLDHPCRVDQVVLEEPRQPHRLREDHLLPGVRELLQSSHLSNRMDIINKNY